MMTPWEIFRHPKRTARLMENLEQKQLELESLAAERLALSEELTGRLKEAEELAERLRKEALLVEQERTEERRQYLLQEEKILAINQEFNKIEQLKQRYETRISALKQRLRDTRRTLGHELLDATQEIAEMGPMPKQKPKPEPQQTQEAADAADWFIDPPEL